MPLYMTSHHVQHVVNNVANEIKAAPHPDIVIPVMTGALFFAADLLRALYPEIDPVVYPAKMNRLERPTKTGAFIAASESKNLYIPGGCQDKRVLIVDTILDSGVTAFALKHLLQEKQARSVAIACLIWRNDPEAKIKPDFYGHDMCNVKHWLVGYGLDDATRGRSCGWIESRPKP